MFKTQTATRYWKLQDFQNNNNSLLISKAVKLVYIDIDNLYAINVFLWENEFSLWFSITAAKSKLIDTVTCLPVC